MSGNYVRELITGMLIPVRKELIDRTYFKYIDMENCVLSGISLLNNNDSPVCILNGMEKYALNHSNSFFYVGCNFKPYDLCKVSSKELCNYIKKHKSIVAWKLELYKII